MNQSPFIDPTHEHNHQKSPNSYSKPPGQRSDYNGNQRVPQQYSQRVAPKSDVAATFSQEGLQTFAQIFSSAVEAAIAKTLPDLVERAVERKLRDLAPLTPIDEEALARRVAVEVTRELRQSAVGTETASNEITASTVAATTAAKSDATATSADATTSTDAATSATATGGGATTSAVVASEAAAPAYAAAVSDTVPSATVAESDQPAMPASPVPSATRRATNTDTEVNAVIEALKQSERPLRTDELRRTVQAVQWGNSASLKMNSIMHKSNGLIERVGRGTYRYAPQA